MKWDEMSWREKNALVAEKVMGGYERFVYSGPSFIYYGVGVRGSYRIEDNFRFNNLQWDVPTDELELGSYVGPNFTSDISAAWEVVEEMQTKGFYIDVLSFSDHYVAVPHLSNGHEPVDDGVATTAPEAICKAALNAMGVDV